MDSRVPAYKNQGLQLQTKESQIQTAGADSGRPFCAAWGVTLASWKSGEAELLLLDPTLGCTINDAL